MEASTALQPPARLDALSVNTIRTLAMDAVQAANSGHPGTPMAMAPVAYTLWQDFLRFDPDDQSGQTAIGLCFPWGTLLRCSTVCYT